MLETVTELVKSYDFFFYFSYFITFILGVIAGKLLG